MTFPTAQAQSGSASTSGSAQRCAPTREVVMYRLAVIALALVPWLIAPGLVQPDTKVDLTISPWAYLARSVDAWNGHAGLGEL